MLPLFPVAAVNSSRPGPVIWPLMTLFPPEPPLMRALVASVIWPAIFVPPVFMRIAPSCCPPLASVAPMPLMTKLFANVPLLFRKASAPGFTVTSPLPNAETLLACTRP